jgi:hypothetical protein
MALKIDNATFGYDANGVDAALKLINAEVIEEAAGKMTESMNTLYEWVDSAWVGQSAEQFKQNMLTDKNMIVDSLRKTYDALENMIEEQVGGTIKEADENLIKAREV